MIALQFLGGGRMAEALVAGLLRAGSHDASAIAVVEVSATRREELTATFPGVDVRAEPQRCQGAVVATKPTDVPAALGSAVSAGVDRVLSIAAGVGCASLESFTGGRLPVVRAMPNTAALVGQGAAAICAGRHAGEEDLAWAEAILGEVGMVIRVPESSMDAVTGLSGSGPAYVFLVAEALVEAGVHAGLPRDVADRLARQTLLGAATLMTRDPAGAGGPEPLEALRASVTSPGGTTAAGLRALEDRAVRAAIIDAVAAATARSAELGQ